MGLLKLKSENYQIRDALKEINDQVDFYLYFVPYFTYLYNAIFINSKHKFIITDITSIVVGPFDDGNIIFYVILNINYLELPIFYIF